MMNDRHLLLLRKITSSARNDGAVGVCDKEGKPIAE